jgi:hypothetical protein
MLLVILYLSGGIFFCVRLVAIVNDFCYRVWIVWGRKHIVIIAPMVILLVGMGRPTTYVCSISTRSD